MKTINIKTINIALLKTHFSKYLKLVQKGESIIVMDRKESIAQIIPIDEKQTSLDERLALEGKIRLPIKPLEQITISKLRFPVKWQDSLKDIRGE